MNRRTFIATAAVGSALPPVAQNYSDYTKDPRPDVAEGTYTAGSTPGPVNGGNSVVADVTMKAV